MSPSKHSFDLTDSSHFFFNSEEADLPLTPGIMMHVYLWGVMFVRKDTYRKKKLYKITKQHENLETETMNLTVEKFTNVT